MCLQQVQRRLFSSSLFCLVMFLLITGFVLEAPAAERQEVVLALYGSRPDLPANIIVDEIIRSTLERELGTRLDFYGDSDALRDWEPGRRITGTLGKVDLRGTVELILRLQPNTREILVISGASPSDQWLRSIARRQLDQLEKRVKLTYMDTGSVEDFERTVAQAPDGTVILFLSMHQDS